MNTNILIIKTSPLSGETNSMEMSMEFEDYLDYVHGRKLVQEAFPYLNDMEREFITSGLTAAEQDDIFGIEEEDFVPSDEIVAMSCDIDESEIPF